MPSVTGTQVVQQAFEQLVVIQPGDTLSTSMNTDGLTLLNSLLSSISAEKYSVFTQVFASFLLAAGQPSYTFGVGGTWNVAVRAQRIVSWSASYIGFRTGGDVLSFPAFQAQAMNPIGMTANIPTILGADEAYPLINVRVHPPPSSAPGQVELAYWTPLLQLAAIGDALILPDGWYQMLWSNLALLLYPKYSRVGGISPELAATAQNSKAVLIQQNAPSAPEAAA